MLKRIKSYLKKKNIEPELHEKLRHIEHITGLPVINPSYYLRAIRHRSMLVEEDFEASDSYERLEFLGDAVLDLIVTEIIFEYYPHKNEGFLTKLRSKLVKGDSLAMYADILELGAIIEVGQRAKGQGIEHSKSILADIFEALVGALYLDQGYNKAFWFVRNILDEHVDMEEILKTLDNFKSTLLEYSQAQGWAVPEYEVVSESGPGHDKTFVIEVMVDGDVMGEGEGKSKKQAEQAAAREALMHLKAGEEYG